ncbi:alpha/beta hydrolase-fold protein [Steroidobacter cummioxidans]|uniref:alpha/beta hydrolase-fold protein n=1 Tax=Steroidobacter cummioxidans TaxID=1803913 RepID=UPI000E31CFF3|nr:alpha/beta hydrolase-fold protein [Steroidobacter cummioxidans]
MKKFRITLSALFAVALALTNAVALASAPARTPTPLSEAEAKQLGDYLQAHWQTPEQYITSKFDRNDIVLLGEDHRIKHNLMLAQRLIPLLYKAGVYNFGMEFGASEDQAALDALVTGERYDEAVARRLMFNYNVGWAFKEYMDIYRVAWELNRSLPAGARKFRILNLSYKFNWEGYTGIRTPVNVGRVFHKGNSERYRADLLRREILEKQEKILILTGSVHAFTRYRQPVNDYLSEGFYRLEDRYMGNLLVQMAPTRVFFIMLHRALDGRTGGPRELVYPAKGAVDQVMARFTDKRVGFDLADTPMGALADDSFHSIGYTDFRLRDLADGYVYEKPFSEYEGCTVDEGFLTEQNWPEAHRQFPDPDMSARPKSLQEYQQRIRDYADIPKRYARVVVGTPAVSSAPVAVTGAGITGDVKKYGKVQSRFVAPRDVWVWLPPSYTRDTARRYPVLYMHDGQNVFDPRTSMNQTDWGVDEAMTRLIAEGAIREAIVVTVANTSRRREEYMPQKAVEWARGTQFETALMETVRQRQPETPSPTWVADSYLKFLVTELKLFIDREYRTSVGRDDTFIMGSSMGGLISLYAMTEYPETFGGAGCLSTHWPIGDGLVVEYLRGRLPDPSTHRIYFDHGTVELDGQYAPYQVRVDEQMQARGYRRDVNWMSKTFEGARHDEAAWRARIDVPLRFLLSKQ